MVYIGPKTSIWGRTITVLYGKVAIVFSSCSFNLARAYNVFLQKQEFIIIAELN